MKKNNFLKVVISIILPLLVGFFGSFFTRAGISPWYETLKKPLLNPPGFVFGPVWTVLYILMGVAFYLVWKKEKEKNVTLPLFVYGAQLILNFLWSFFFFGIQSPETAFVIILLLWILILFNMILFYRIQKRAGYLFLPYLLWVSFATYLNYSLWILN